MSAASHPLVRALAEAAERRGLSLGDPANLSATLYAVNDEAYGSQNVLLSDRRGYRAVFKRSRDPQCATRLVARMRALNERLDRPEHRILREQVVRSFDVRVGEGAAETTWLMAAYANGPSAYVDLRSDPTGRRLAPTYERALEFAAALHASSTGSTPLGELVDNARAALDDHGLRESAPPVTEPAPDEVDTPVPIGITHLDLVPDNMLVTRRGDLWIDWEYWDVGPTTFNALDAMLSFGSLAGLNPWSRRDEVDDLRAFSPPPNRPWPALQRLTTAHLVRTAPRLADPASIRALLDVYYAAKSTAQSRVYGQIYGFSRRRLADWHRVVERPEWIEAFARRWPR